MMVFPLAFVVLALLPLRSRAACAPLVSYGRYVSGDCGEDGSDVIFGQECQRACLESEVRAGGDAFRTCQVDDNWSGIPLLCVSYCPDLPNGSEEHVQYASGTCSQAYNGQVCELECKSGYRAIAGNSQRACRADGSWNGAPLMCEPMPTCPNIAATAPARLTVVSSGCSGDSRPGEVCELACADPSIQKPVRGEDSLICLESGVWDGEALECEPLTECSVTDLVGGNAVLVEGMSHESCSTLPYEGIRCFLECTPGFFRHAGPGEPSGPTLSAVCGGNGKWSDEDTGITLAFAFECGPPLACSGDAFNTEVNHVRQSVGSLEDCHGGGTEGVPCAVECASPLYVCDKLAPGNVNLGHNCYGKCGRRSGGLCPEYCGGGSCCRKNWAGCSSLSVGISAHKCTWDEKACSVETACEASGGQVAAWAADSLNCVERTRCPDLLADSDSTHAVYVAGSCSLPGVVCPGCESASLQESNADFDCGTDEVESLGIQPSLESCARACHETPGCSTFSYGVATGERSGVCSMRSSETSCSSTLPSLDTNIYSTDIGLCSYCSADPFRRDPISATKDTFCELACPMGYVVSAGDTLRTCGEGGMWSGETLECIALEGAICLEDRLGDGTLPHGEINDGTLAGEVMNPTEEIHCEVRIVSGTGYGYVTILVMFTDIKVDVDFVRAYLGGSADENFVAKLHTVGGYSHATGGLTGKWGDAESGSTWLSYTAESEGFLLTFDKFINPAYDDEGNLLPGVSSVEGFEGFKVLYFAGGNLAFSSCCLTFPDSIAHCWKIHCTLPGCVADNRERTSYWDGSRWVAYDSKLLNFGAYDKGGSCTERAATDGVTTTHSCTCPSLSDLGSNTVIVSGKCTGDATITDECVMGCADGYDAASGSPWRQCQANGHWNGEALQCVKRCNTEIDPSGDRAIVLYSSEACGGNGVPGFGPQSGCRLKCASGFVESAGTSGMCRCADGKWECDKSDSRQGFLRCERELCCAAPNPTHDTASFHSEVALSAVATNENRRLVTPRSAHIVETGALERCASEALFSVDCGEHIAYSGLTPGEAGWNRLKSSWRGNYEREWEHHLPVAHYFRCDGRSNYNCVHKNKNNFATWISTDRADRGSSFSYSEPNPNPYLTLDFGKRVAMIGIRIFPRQHWSEALKIGYHQIWFGDVELDDGTWDNSSLTLCWEGVDRAEYYHIEHLCDDWSRHGTPNLARFAYLFLPGGSRNIALHKAWVIAPPLNPETCDRLCTATENCVYSAFEENTACLCQGFGANCGPPFSTSVQAEYDTLPGFRTRADAVTLDRGGVQGANDEDPVPTWTISMRSPLDMAQCAAFPMQEIAYDCDDSTYPEDLDATKTDKKGCKGDELLMFDAGVDNPGKTRTERVEACAAACRTATHGAGFFDDDSCVPSVNSLQPLTKCDVRYHTRLNGQIRGFRVDPDSGECACESQDSATCVAVNEGGTSAARYDFAGGVRVCGNGGKFSGSEGLKCRPAPMCPPIEFAELTEEAWNSAYQCRDDPEWTDGTIAQRQTSREFPECITDSFFYIVAADGGSSRNYPQNHICACAPIPDAASDAWNSRCSEPGGMPVGTRCKVRCKGQGVVSGGNDERVCMPDGTWSGAPLRCEAPKGCTNDPTTTLENIVVSDLSTTIGSLVKGDIVPLKCKSELYVASPGVVVSEAVCEGENLFSFEGGISPKCVPAPTCPYPGVSTGATWARAPSRAVDACNETVSGWRYAGYRGCQNTARNGMECLPWTDADAETQTNGVVSGENFCRSLDSNCNDYCNEGIQCRTQGGAIQRCDALPAEPSLDIQWKRDAYLGLCDTSTGDTVELARHHGVNSATKCRLLCEAYGPECSVAAFDGDCILYSGSCDVQLATPPASPSGQIFDSLAAVCPSTHPYAYGRGKLNKCCSKRVTNGGMDFGPWGSDRPNSCSGSDYVPCTVGPDSAAAAPCRDFDPRIDSNDGDKTTINLTPWNKVLRHDSANGAFFEHLAYPEVYTTNAHCPDCDLYMDIANLEDYRRSDGRFVFKLSYPKVVFAGWADDGGVGYTSMPKTNTWSQTSNPVTQDSHTQGYIAVAQVSTAKSFAGVHARVSKKWPTVMAGGTNSFWFSMGAMKPYQAHLYKDSFTGGMRGGTLEQEVELYVLSTPTLWRKYPAHGGGFPGQSIVYKCNDPRKDERVLGDELRTCLESGEWTGSELVCEAKPRCLEPLPSVTTRHTERVPDDTISVCEGALRGDACTLRCKFGYTRVEGDTTRTCGWNGGWDGKPLMCLPDPTSICVEHGDLSSAASMISDGSGTSPIPLNAPEECVWPVNTGCSGGVDAGRSAAVTVRILDIDLVDGEDFLVVYDGATTDAPVLLARRRGLDATSPGFTGGNDPQWNTVTTTGYNALLHLRLSSRTNATRGGFRGIYYTGAPQYIACVNSLASDSNDIAACQVAGNGVVEGDEQCDDGNDIDGDGCGAGMQLEVTVCKANEYEVVAPVLECATEGYGMRIAVDRQCKPISDCEEGVTYQSVSPTDTSDRQCSQLTICDLSTHWVSAKPSLWSDRECSPLTECAAVGIEYEATPPTEFADRTCMPVDPMPCPEGAYIFSQPSETADKECLPEHWDPDCDAEDYDNSEGDPNTCSLDPMDVFLLVGASRNLVAEGCEECWSDVQSFVADMLEGAYCMRAVGKADMDATRISVLTWSSSIDWSNPSSSSFYSAAHTVQLEISSGFGDLQQTLFRALDGVSQSGKLVGGGVHPASALDHVRTTLESQRESDDDLKHRRVLVVLVTDDEFGAGEGEAVANVRPKVKAATMEAGEKLKELPGLELATVGIGSRVDEDALAQLASDTNLAYFVSSYSDLGTAVSELVTDEVACIDPTEIYLVCPGDTDPQVWIVAHTMENVNIESYTMEYVLRWAEGKCNLDILTNLPGENDGDNEHAVLVSVVPGDGPSISHPETFSPGCMPHWCGATTLDDEGVNGLNTIFISWITPSPTTSAPTTMYPTSEPSSTPTLAPTDSPTDVPSSAPTVADTTKPTSLPTTSPTYACANARDNKAIASPGYHSCQTHWSHPQGGDCRQQTTRAECDGFCGLCECSTADPTSTKGEHCSGHGTCEAFCDVDACQDARCVCDAGWTGSRCGEIVPSTAPTMRPTLPGCRNGNMDGTETDVDCGGGECERCEDGERCDDGERDCVSGVCRLNGDNSIRVCVERTGSPTGQPTPRPMVIFVVGPDGRDIGTFTVTKDDTIDEIQQRIELYFGVPPEDQIITHDEGGGVSFTNGYDVGTTTLNDVGVEDKHTLRLHTPSPTAAPTRAHIFVDCGTGSSLKHKLNVDLEVDTVTSVQLRAKQLCGVPVNEQNIHHLEGGGELPCIVSTVDESDSSCGTLGDEGVHSGDTLLLTTKSPTPAPTVTSVRIRCPDNSVHVVGVDLTRPDGDTVLDIWYSIYRACGVQPQDQVITIDGEDFPRHCIDLTDPRQCLLGDEDVEHDDWVIVSTSPPSLSPTPSPTSLFIFVKYYDGWIEKYDIGDLDSDRCSDVHSWIETTFDIPFDDQIIKHKEKGYAAFVCDDESLGEMGLDHLHTLILYTAAPTPSPTTKAPTLPFCRNGRKDGTETDVDCGGTSCGKCGDGDRCEVGQRDCASGTCTFDDISATMRCATVTEAPTVAPTMAMVFIECPNGDTHTIEVASMHDLTVGEIQIMAEGFCGIPPDDQILTVDKSGPGGDDGAILCFEDESCLVTCLDHAGIEHLDTIVLSTVAPTPAPTSEIVYVRCPGGVTHAIEVNLLRSPPSTVHEVAVFAEAKCGVPVTDQVLTHDERNSREVERCSGDNGIVSVACDTDNTLTEEGVRNGDTLALDSASPTPAPTASLVRVDCLNIPRFSITVILDETTIGDIKQRVEENCGIPANEVILEHNDEAFSCDLADANTASDRYHDEDPYQASDGIGGSFCDGTTLEEEGVPHLGIIVVMTLTPTSSPTSEPTVVPHLIYVVGLDGRTEIFHVNLDTDTVDEIKQRIEDEFGVPVDEQNIKHREGGDVPFGDKSIYPDGGSDTLTDVGVLNEDVLFLIAPELNSDGVPGNNEDIPPPPPRTIIYVEVPWQERTETFEVILNQDTVQDIQERIARTFKIPVSKQIITHEELDHSPWGLGPFANTDTLHVTSVGDRHTLVLHTLAPTPAPSMERIFVEVPWLDRIETFYVDTDVDTVHDIKERIEVVFGIPYDSQIITHEERGHDAWGDGPSSSFAHTSDETLQDTRVFDQHTLVLHTIPPTSSPTRTIIHVEVPWMDMTRTFEVDLEDDTVWDVRTRIADELGVPFYEQIITHRDDGGIQWKPSTTETLTNANLEHDHTLVLHLAPPTSYPTSVKIFVTKAWDRDDIVEYEVDLLSDTIDEIKDRVQGWSGIHPDDQTLTFDGFELTNGRSTLDAEGIVNLDTLILIRSEAKCPPRDELIDCPTYSQKDCTKKNRGKGRCTRCSSGTCFPGTSKVVCDDSTRYDHCYTWVYVETLEGERHRFNVWVDTDTLADLEQRVADKLGWHEEDVTLVFLNEIVSGESTSFDLLQDAGTKRGVRHRDTLYLKNKDFCLGGKYWAGSTWPCDSGNPTQNWGPPSWTDQNGKKNANRFDRCRGFDGENEDYTNEHGDFICVEADRDGTAAKGSDMCSGLVTYAEAKAHCEGMHARLCTQEELQASCAERTGCDYDYTWIWSNTPCVPNSLFGEGLSGHLVSPGDMRKWTTRFEKSQLPHTPGNVGWGMPNSGDCFGCDNTGVNIGNENRGGCRNFNNPGLGRHGQCGGLGVDGTVTEGWILERGKRYLYLDAMADLFDEFAARALGCNPEEDDEFGQCCLPDNGPTLMFTRCCADHVKQYCASCPPGKTNDEGAGKTIESCHCIVGSLDDRGACTGSPTTPPPSTSPPTFDLNGDEDNVVDAGQGESDATPRPSAYPTKGTPSPTLQPSSRSPTSFPTDRTTQRPTDPRPTFFPTVKVTKEPTQRPVPTPTQYPSEPESPTSRSPTYIPWSNAQHEAVPTAFPTSFPTASPPTRRGTPTSYPVQSASPSSNNGRNDDGTAAGVFCAENMFYYANECWDCPELTGNAPGVGKDGIESCADEIIVKVSMSVDVPFAIFERFAFVGELQAAIDATLNSNGINAHALVSLKKAAANVRRRQLFKAGAANDGLRHGSPRRRVQASACGNDATDIVLDVATLDADAADTIAGLFATARDNALGAKVAAYVSSRCTDFEARDAAMALTSVNVCDSSEGGPVGLENMRLAAAEATSWRLFYDGAGGEDWLVGGVETCCRLTPCSGACTAGDVSVVCSVDDDGDALHIVRVHIAGNNAVVADGASLIDLANEKFGAEIDFVGDENGGDAIGGNVAVDNDSSTENLQSGGNGDGKNDDYFGLTQTLIFALVGTIILLCICVFGVFWVFYARRTRKEEESSRYQNPNIELQHSVKFDEFYDAGPHTNSGPSLPRRPERLSQGGGSSGGHASPRGRALPHRPDGGPMHSASSSKKKGYASLAEDADLHDSGEDQLAML